jgi:diguanylate cyclase (GGDEF)-like protein
MSIVLTFFQAGTRGMRQWGYGMIGMGLGFSILTQYSNIGPPALYAGWTCLLVAMLVMYGALLRICGRGGQVLGFGILVVGGAAAGWLVFDFVFPNPTRQMDVTAIAGGIIGGRAAWDLWRHSRRSRYPAPALAVALWLMLVAARPIMEVLVRDVHDGPLDPELMFGPPTLVFFRALVMSLLSMSVLWLEVSQLYETVELQATRDDLTGIANRRGIVALLQRELARALRTNATCSVVMFDIDHFKQVNDSRGHHAGDRVICWVTEVIGKSIRPYDTLGRYGGEEFLLVIPGAGPDAAVVVANRARLAVEGQFCVVDGDPMAITVSAGVATLAPHIDGEGLLRLADDALYRAKEAGRNRVVLAAPAPDPNAG